MKRNANNNGITLIALVVTIIVLLILAGVSISMLTGQNGILNRVAEAKNNTDSVSDLEYLQLKATEALMNYYHGNDSVGEDEYVLKKWAEDTGNKIQVNQTDKTLVYNGKKYSISDVIGNQSEKTKIENDNMKQITTSTVKDSDTESKEILANGKVRLIIEENDTSMKAAIPNGFYYVTGKPSTGLVISDRYGDDDNNSKGGNQFVWVPCSGKNGVTYEATNGLAATWRKNYSDFNYYYKEYIDWSDEEWKDENSTSVATYGGFYVARYEAGVPSDASFSLLQNSAKYTGDKNDVSLVPVSKKNNQSWNYISQTNAKTVSEKMYDASKAAVKSQLIDSYAWDTIVEWMKREDQSYVTASSDKGNYFDNNTITDVTNGWFAYHLYVFDLKTGATGSSTYWNFATKYQKGKFEPGRVAVSSNSIRHNYEFAESAYNSNYQSFYIYKELATGASEKTKVRNIYDMAGNMWEWTTETGKHNSKDGNETTTYAVIRGGAFYDDGSKFPVSRRDGNIKPEWPGDQGVGFRVVLYIQ